MISFSQFGELNLVGKNSPFNLSYLNLKEKQNLESPKLNVFVGKKSKSDTQAKSKKFLVLFIDSIER